MQQQNPAGTISGSGSSAVCQFWTDSSYVAWPSRAGTGDDDAVASDPASYVRNHRQSDGSLLLWGSLSILHALIAAGELREPDLFIAPVVLGNGRRLFEEPPQEQLHLVAAEGWGGTRTCDTCLTGASTAWGTPS